MGMNEHDIMVADASLGTGYTISLFDPLPTMRQALKAPSAMEAHSCPFMVLNTFHCQRTPVFADCLNTIIRNAFLKT